MMKADDEKHGVTEHKVYSLDGGDSGYMHIFKRKDAYEIHHEISDPNNPGNMISGKMIGGKSPNTKFVGTMFNVAKRILNANKAVRIVGNHTNGMFDHYNRLATILAKRHNKVIKPPEKYSLDKPWTKDYQEIVIHGINAEHPLQEMYYGIRDSRNKTNNYGLGFSQSWLSPAKPTTMTELDYIMEPMIQGNI